MTVLSNKVDDMKYLLISQGSLAKRGRQGGRNVRAPGNSLTALFPLTKDEARIAGYRQLWGLGFRGFGFIRVEGLGFRVGFARVYG